ncbi:MAG: tetratricopeptide repeat protein [Melioribacteraceae bacterium]|nr:tetratricopeptide repeat protein [Melioribacteraceae bacterium]
MRFKPVYIYLLLFVVVIAALVFFSDTTKKGTSTNSNNQMPNDEIHSNIDAEGDVPSKDNVMAEVGRRLDSLTTEVKKNPNDTLKVRELADLLTMAHRPDEAVAYYESILKRDPRRIDILLQLTFVHYQTGEFDLAENYTNKILQIDSKSAIALFNLAAIAQAKGDSEKAKKIWEKVAKENPNSQIGHIAEQSIIQLNKIKAGTD